MTLNAIIGNVAGDSGGGMYDCHGTIESNRILLNRATYHGSGVFDENWRGELLTLRNNIIASNYWVNIDAEALELENCTVWGESEIVGGG